MLKEFPVYLVRRCDGPRGRARRLVGYAQLTATVIMIEAEAARQGWKTRTRALAKERADRVIALAKVATRKSRKRDLGA